VRRLPLVRSGRVRFGRDTLASSGKQRRSEPGSATDQRATAFARRGALRTVEEMRRVQVEAVSTKYCPTRPAAGRSRRSSATALASTTSLSGRCEHYVGEDGARRVGAPGRSVSMRLIPQRRTATASSTPRRM